jgi:hypothetical protein
MSPVSLFTIQIGIDVLICALILYFLWRFGQKSTGTVVSGEQERQELGRLIAESQKSAQQFLDALAEGRRALKEIAYALDERESRLKTLCLRADALSSDPDSKVPDADADSSASLNKEKVLRMAIDGSSVPDIVRQTGLAEGEVRLIIDLARSRDENR